MNKICFAILTLAACLPAGAKEIRTIKVPAVVNELRTRYKLPEPMKASSGARTARDLADLVAIEQHYFPGAVVTAGFYDWRTLSRYRSHAGLHLGYDIAMPYGNSFAAGWPGVITSIVVWSGEEHGITVESPDGTQVTYGHVAPKCAVGQQVQAGEVLGTIARDHVDVKMRDAAGNYVDYGGNGRVVPSPQWAGGGGWATPQATPEALMASWLMASNNVDLAKQELERFELESEQRLLERQRLKARIPVLEHSVSMMKDYVERGLVARVTAEESRGELDKARARFAKIKGLGGGDDRQVKVLKTSLQSAKDRLQQSSSQAQKRGIGWKDVESFVNRTVASDVQLRKNVSSYKKAAATKNEKRLKELDGKLKDSESTLKSLEELYEMGGVARLDLEGARNKHKVLLAQVRALRALSDE